MVIIGGAGRSGTHLLANILKSHPTLTVDIEREPQFTYSIDAVLRGGVSFDNLYRIYRQKPTSYVTKDYPAIWLFWQLKTLLPDLKLIAIRRNVYETVASTLKHEGTRNWLIQHQNYPPNPFSGTAHFAYQQNDSLATRATYRWLLHDDLINVLQYHPDVCVVTYNLLTDYPDVEMKRIANFLEIENNFKLPAIYNTSGKWRDVLTPQQIYDIDAVLDTYG